MAKVFIEETTLTSIGDAIRAKTGSSELIAPLDMADEINGITTGGGGDIEVEPIVLTGSQTYGCAGVLAGKYINMYGDTITTKDITAGNNMFYHNNGVDKIPFDLNFKNNVNSSVNNMFYSCEKLKLSPKINNIRVSECSYIFYNCLNLREIPEDWCDTWDWSYIESLTSQYSGNRSYTFSSCFSLRKFPMDFLNHGNPNVNNGYSIYYCLFNTCVALDEVIGLPVPHYNATWTSNAFYSGFSACSRLKNMTFALQEDNTPYVVNWKSQTIDLTLNVGYSSSTSYILNYNSGITADKQVTDDTTYQSLKNDADWWTTNVSYSRYNHDSAVATINSLPDTSAYLATAGGTNTIKFKGAAGSKTDGGAINTLTEEEIAVATAKGWTVSLV